MFYLLRRFSIAAALASVLFLPLVALADESAQIVITDPTGGVLAAVPGGIYIYALLVAIAGIVSTFVSDAKMPALLRKVVNFLALNVGKARNDSSVND